MPTNDAEIKKETKIWVESATEWIKSLINDGQQIIVQITGMSDWVRKGEYFSLQNINTYSFIHFVYENINKLPAYKRYETILKKDKIIGPQIDKMVSSPIGGATIDCLNLSLRLIPNPGYFLGQDKYDFEKNYRALIHPLFEKHITYCTIAPILGLSIDSEIKLDQTTKLKIMNDEEIKSALNAGLSNLHSFPNHFFIPNKGKLPCIEIQHKLPKYIDSLSKKEEQKMTEQFQKLHDENNEKLEKFRQILLLMDYQIDYSGIYNSSKEVFMGGISYSAFRSTKPIFTTAELTNTSQLTKYWKIITNKAFPSSIALSLSLRRLGYSTQRIRIEDKILDLLIAAEAFYMAGENDERTDIGYKLRLRAAFWYDGTEKREQIMAYFSKAYDLRSKIAHGNSIPNTIKINGTETTIEEFIKIIEEILICAFKKALKNWNATGKNTIDWNKLILGNK